MTENAGFTKKYLVISTHTLTWSVTFSLSFSISSSYISTHTLTWSVTELLPVPALPVIFQLTRSRGAWLIFRTNLRLSRVFQLTRSRGAWPSWQTHCQWQMGISTHTLTWSVTRRSLSWYYRHSISTHTLTWSVTTLWSNATNTGAFQLTRSRGAWLPKSAYPYQQRFHFNSHAHVERDEMGLGKISDIKHFNSHAHVERDRYRCHLQKCR